MTSTPRLRLLAYVWVFAVRDIFPVSFFGRDLRERARTFFASLRSCVSTFLNLTTLTLLVLTTTLVAALQVGTVGWLRDYVESNPLARTVEVSSMMSTRTATLEAEDLEELRALEVPAEAAPITGAFGWNDVTFWLFDSAGAQDETLTHGRTVDPLDPVLGRLDYVTGDGLFLKGEDGKVGVGQVVVSLSLLDALGYGREAPFPELIHLDYHGLKAPIEVIGVARETPAGELVLTEDFYRAIQDRRWNPLPTRRGFYWGPVAPSPRLDALLERLAPFLEQRRLEVRVEPRSGNSKWLVFERGEGWTDDKWRQLVLPVLERLLTELEPNGTIEWFEEDAPALEAFARLESEFTRASVYVDELAHVPAVAAAVADLGYKVTSNSRELAKLFLQVSSLGRGILFAVITVVGGLAAVSLVLSFSQSIQRKTPEIAILKAYGASSSLVLFAYVLEALILWAASTALGLFLAGRVAAGVDARLVELLRLRGELAAAAETSLVSMPPFLQLTVAIGSLLLCVGSTLLAGSLAVRLQPARALSLHR